MKFQIAVIACMMALCLQNAMAQSYAGGTCDFSTSGVAACTSTSNGFCALDTFTTTGSPLTAAAATGKCICYAGYSGSTCGTFTTPSTTTTAATNNALGVLAVGALAAYFLSGAGSSGSGFGGNGDLTGTDLLYLQQAQQVQG